MTFQSKLHRHDKKCRVPLNTLFSPLPPGTRANNYSYYVDTSADGRDFVKLNGVYALEGCAELKIPIFLSKMPDGLEVAGA